MSRLLYIQQLACAGDPVGLCHNRRRDCWDLFTLHVMEESEVEEQKESSAGDYHSDKEKGGSVVW